MGSRGGNLAECSGQSWPNYRGPSCAIAWESPARSLAQRLEVLANSWRHSWATALGKSCKNLANCLGNLGRLLGKFWEGFSFSKYSKDLGQRSWAFLGDCLGKASGKSCKTLWGIKAKTREAVLSDYLGESFKVSCKLPGGPWQVP